MNQGEVAKRLFLLAESFGVKLSPLRFAIYLYDLADLDAVELCESLTTARRQMKSFPSIAEIRHAVDTRAALVMLRERNNELLGPL